MSELLTSAGEVTGLSPRSRGAAEHPAHFGVTWQRLCAQEGVNNGTKGLYYTARNSLGIGFPRGLNGKEPSFQHRRCRRLGCSPFVGKIPWRRKWQPTPVFVLGKCHGQRNLTGYSPWGCQASDAPEHKRTGFSRDKGHEGQRPQSPAQCHYHTET